MFPIEKHTQAHTYLLRKGIANDSEVFSIQLEYYWIFHFQPVVCVRGVRTFPELVDIISKGTILGGATTKKARIKLYRSFLRCFSLSPISRGSVACEKRMDNSFHLLYRRVEEKIKRKASFLFLLTVLHHALSLYSPLHGQ